MRVLILVAVCVMAVGCGDDSANRTTSPPIPADLQSDTTSSPDLAGDTDGHVDSVDAADDAMDEQAPDVMMLSVCGDGVCAQDESGELCPADCDVCGDTLCGDQESPATCSEDCGPDPMSFAMVNDVPEEVVETPNEAIDAYVRVQIATQPLQGVAVGVVDRGEVVYLKGYGYEDIERGLPVLAKVTKFRWASVAKTLTGLTAGKLALDGVVDLDAPIETYYTTYMTPANYLVDGMEEPIPAGERVITLRRLLGHLAGIQHYTNGAVYPVPLIGLDNPAINTGIEWALTTFINAPLVDIPGHAYHYTTFGMNLAGVVMAYAADESFDALVQRYIAEPAGMTTLAPDYEWEQINNRAVGYVQNEDGSWRAVPSEDVSYKLPGGGYLSTAEDLTRYCAALMDEEIVDPPLADLIWTRQTTTDGESINYGLGFRINGRDGRPYVEHSGSQNKTRTRLRYYHEDGLCLVMMSNTEGANTYTFIRGLEDVVRATR